MRGLIILQPYAGLFSAGLKVNKVGEMIEFRSRSTNIREQVAIYAALHKIPCSRCPARIAVHHCDGEWGRCYPQPDGNPLEEARGAIVAVAKLTDCRSGHYARDWSVLGAPERLADWLKTWAWVFTDLRALPKPIPCKPPRGARVWFTVPKDVEAEVLRQTAREGRGEEGHE